MSKGLKQLEKCIRKGWFDEAIEMGSQLYATKTGNNSTCLEHILCAYRKTTRYPKEEILQRLLKLLNDTPPKTPAFCILQNEIGMYYVSCQNQETAIRHFKEVLSVKKDIPDVYNNLAVCYTQLKQYDKASVCLNLSLRLSPCDNIYNRLGELNFYLKQYDMSIEAYKKMQHPSTDNLYNSCFPYLGKKRFIEGFSLYENRLKENKICPQTNEISRVEIPGVPYWNGSEACSHVMIVYEQGIGDNIQFFRYVIELSHRYPDMQITYFCKSVVSHLFDVQPYQNISVVSDAVPLNLSAFERKAYIMSLPHLLQIKDIQPCRINYIRVDESNHALWRERVNRETFHGKLKVGIMYSGLLVSYIDKHIQLEDFEDICTDPHFQTFCLHKLDDKIRTDLQRISFADKIQVFENMDSDRPFVDTISLLRNLDVIITIDTSIAHLAGVMGIKTLLLIGYSSDWRWFDNDDKVWYTSVEIIRMRENKPLSALLPRVKTLLLNQISKE